MRILTTLFIAMNLLHVTGQSPVNDSIPVPGQWSVEKINNWYKKQPWLVGCNYYPATAINQIDMWQASSWDPERIDLELGWAEEIGMNTLRVYLHDVVWENDEKGLYKRMDDFLNICENHGIRPWFVFFDDCHYPNPKMGKQPLPVKGFHNSGWLNCPSRDLSMRYAEGKASRKEVEKLKGYVQKTMLRFENDKRVLMWELYNEPGRSGKKELSNQLVYDSWVWAREINPSQPIMSNSSGSVGERNIKINRINSDLHSIHCYWGDQRMRNEIIEYQKDQRPVIVSEWLARTLDSKVESSLKIMKELNSGAVNWGFVCGKTGTVWDWNSRKDENGNRMNPDDLREKGQVVNPGEEFPEPEVWFHDLFRIDGSAYDPEEIKVFKKLTGKK